MIGYSKIHSGSNCRSAKYCNFKFVIHFHIPLIQRYRNSHNYTHNTTRTNIYKYTQYADKRVQKEHLSW